ncbi:MAG: PQQ-binding-like beta-propeller repeat protein [Vicinamibacterales bacterium]
MVLRAALLLASLAGPARAQDGPALYRTYCAICHDGGDERAPARSVLGRMSADQILQALDRGAMRTQAAERSRVQRRILAEFLSGTRVSATDPFEMTRSAFCPQTASTGAASPAPARPAPSNPGWNGWGVTPANTRFQTNEAAGLTAADLPRLRLKWAFGFPGASSAGTQPVVHAGRVYVGSVEGDVWALDARTGCVYWRLEVEASIRSALLLDTRPDGTLVGYFGDQVANVYAIDARAGKVLWKVKVDDHDRAAITAAPQLFGGRLYVPVSSREESQVGNPRYPCCRFRGSIVALDAATGRLAWKTFLIAEEPGPTVKNSIGTQLWGPSGAAVWTSPTIDPKRRRLYIGTSNNYSVPATKTSDAVMALDLDKGAIAWTRQLQAGDIWNGSCRSGSREPAVCPDADAPDVDYSASPVLVDRADGTRVLLAGNKGGVITAFDPDADGRVLWERKLFEWQWGGGFGIIWGMASDGERLYAANGAEIKGKPELTGGMAALEVANGRVIWRTPAPPCGARTPCKPTSPGAVSAMPGAAFAGTFDGQLRAYGTGDGAVLWEYDSLQDYPTVNGVPARGGSMSNAGPTIAGGMIFMQSGYSHHGAVAPGNVLLAFGLD